MQNTGKVGWLYSVIAPGLVSADAPLELVSRVSDVTVQEAAAIAWHMPFDDEQYHRLLSAAIYLSLLVSLLTQVHPTFIPSQFPSGTS